MKASMFHYHTRNRIEGCLKETYFSIASVFTMFVIVINAVELRSFEYKKVEFLHHHLGDCKHNYGW